MSLVPEGILQEAKSTAASCAAKGKLLTPEQAWFLSGETKDAQTLWSIAFHLAMRTGESAEEINTWLEAQFPQYAKRSGEDQPRGSNFLE